MGIKSILFEHPIKQDSTCNSNVPPSPVDAEYFFPLQYTMKTDSFERANSQETTQTEINKDNKTTNAKKILTGVGISLAFVGSILMFRNKPSVAGTKRHFKKLLNNLPKTQEKLKTVFKNENLSEEEAINILKRYEKIELDGLTMSKEEYTKAVFEEAKNNFKLEDNFNLIFENMDKKVGGYTDKTIDVFIQKFLSKDECFDAIHHELCHKYQFEAINELRKTRIGALYGINQTIPPERLSYAKKMAKAYSNYTPYNKNHRLYYKNPIEVDARSSGETMWILIRGRSIKERFLNNIHELTDKFKSIFKGHNKATVSV